MVCNNKIQEKNLVHFCDTLSCIGNFKKLFPSPTYCNETKHQRLNLIFH
jgi:hypothetical protein